jgi:hypothetical protein
MKPVKGLMVAAAVSCLIVSFSCAAFAQSKEARVKTLKDAASALKQSQPEIAKGLTDWMNVEAGVTKETMGALNGAEAKLLIAAAGVLEKSNPVLAKELRGMAEGTQKKQMQKLTSGTPAKP